MDNLISWYTELPVLLQVFWGCAILSSLVFVVQMILTLVGMDSSDVDVDFDGSDTMDLGGGLSLFTIKNFVGFLVGFGWAGVSFYGMIANRLLLVLAAFAVGCLFVFCFGIFGNIDGDTVCGKFIRHIGKMTFYIYIFHMMVSDRLDVMDIQEWWEDRFTGYREGMFIYQFGYTLLVFTISLCISEIYILAKKCFKRLWEFIIGQTHQS